PPEPVTTPTRPVPATGVACSTVVPSPSSPYALSPAHASTPFAITHVVSSPAKTPDAPAVAAVTGSGNAVISPLPIWPQSLSPQHCSAPRSVIAHEKLVPVAIARAHAGVGPASMASSGSNPTRP